ncbi:MAG TPA: nucleoside hydrolase, partial [Chitinophagaceae bacterium]|nr:nucleoside hydrolase [Chitinophagaceae bacterium]
LVAIKGWQPFYDLETGTCTINAEGVNEWEPGGTNEARLIEKQSPQVMSEIINQLIMHQPVKR